MIFIPKENKPRAGRVPFNGQDDALIITMRHKQITWKVIGEKLNRVEGSVCRRYIMITKTKPTHKKRVRVKPTFKVSKADRYWLSHKWSNAGELLAQCQHKDVFIERGITHAFINSQNR